MGHLSIRDLQKISGEAIQNLPGVTAIKSGGRTIALLTPLKKPDVAKLDAALELAEQYAVQRDPDVDTQFLQEVGADPTDWSREAVEAFLAEIRHQQDQ